MIETDPEFLALLAACRHRPADDAPRLILSDWLEEHDEDAWAELIRVQCELERLEDRDGRRYGLRQEGVAGLSPDAEPDAQRLGPLADLVKRQGVTTVFTEELVSPRIADTLAREAGVKTDTLNPLEGLTDTEVAFIAD